MPEEYISREAALEITTRTCEDYAAAFAEIRKLPDADVAPVVRCKGCKYGSYDSKSNGAMVCLRTNDGFWRKETDFCSYGERKEGDNDNVSD